MFLCTAFPVAADDLTGNIAWTTDYRFRGESLSNRLPEFQGGIDYGHSSGLFAGVFASGVRTPTPQTHLIAQLYAGYAHSVADGLVAEGGVVRYDYWHSLEPYSYNYTEGFVGLASERWNVRLYGTDSYFNSGAKGGYLEGTVSRELWGRLQGSLHAGVLATGPANSIYSDYNKALRVDGRAGLAMDFSWVQVEVSAVAMAARHGDCANGTHRCSPGVLLTLRHGF